MFSCLQNNYNKLVDRVNTHIRQYDSEIYFITDSEHRHGKILGVQDRFSGEPELDIYETSGEFILFCYDV